MENNNTVLHKFEDMLIIKFNATNNSFAIDKNFLILHSIDDEDMIFTMKNILTVNSDWRDLLEEPLIKKMKEFDDSVGVVSLNKACKKVLERLKLGVYSISNKSLEKDYISHFENTIYSLDKSLELYNNKK